MGYIAKRTTGAAGAPLLVTCHGTGGTENQFHDFARGLMPQGHITSPRGDVSEHGALRYFRRTGEGVYDMDDLALRTAAMADFITAEIAATAAPRAIGLGYSNGANILAAVALARGDVLDDLVLLHPLIPWHPAPQPKLAGKRILITAGAADTICPAPMTRDFAAYLTDQGAIVQLHWHNGGHDIASSEIDAITAFVSG